MEKIKTNYTTAEIESYDSDTIVEILNDLCLKNKQLEEENKQLEIVSNYRQQLLDKANACLNAVEAVLKLR